MAGQSSSIARTANSFLVILSLVVALQVGDHRFEVRVRYFRLPERRHLGRDPRAHPRGNQFRGQIRPLVDNGGKSTLVTLLEDAGGAFARRVTDRTPVFVYRAPALDQFILGGCAVCSVEAKSRFCPEP